MVDVGGLNAFLQDPTAWTSNFLIRISEHSTTEPLLSYLFKLLCKTMGSCAQKGRLTLSRIQIVWFNCKQLQLEDSGWTSYFNPLCSARTLWPYDPVVWSQLFKMKCKDNFTCMHVYRILYLYMWQKCLSLYLSVCLCVCLSVCIVCLHWCHCPNILSSKPHIAFFAVAWDINNM